MPLKLRLCPALFAAGNVFHWQLSYQLSTPPYCCLSFFAVCACLVACIVVHVESLLTSWRHCSTSMPVPTEVSFTAVDWHWLPAPVQQRPSASISRACSCRGQLAAVAIAWWTSKCLSRDSRAAERTLQHQMVARMQSSAFLGRLAALWM